MSLVVPQSQRPQRVLAVLGMHRSGTSCLTGSLQAGGLFLGKHHTWNEYNRKGNRENQDVVNLHEAIFKMNNASWNTPQRQTNWVDRYFKRRMKWHKQHLQRATEILSEYSHERIWGFKDPRALFLLHGWEKLTPNIEYVGIFRHPLSVAQSLNSRPALPISIEEGLQMWLGYNQALLKAHQKKNFPLFCFDWSEDEFHQKLNYLHSDLQLNAVDDEQRFYSADLHKQRAEEKTALPPAVTELYQALCARQYEKK